MCGFQGERPLFPVMNNTKWRELRIAMDELSKPHPKWRTKCVENEYISTWDVDWYYHFSEGGYKDIEWVEIKTENDEQNHKVLSELKKIHIPGHKTEHGFKVYGYLKENQSVDYI
jgi:hypothetical protein